MNPRTLFRTVAVAEAISWGVLLSAMFMKYVTETEPFGLHEGGVPVAGAVHGGLFILYCLVTLNVREKFNWSGRTTLVALAAAIPPFCTYVFELVADRRGMLAIQK